MDESSSGTKWQKLFQRTLEFMLQNTHAEKKLELNLSIQSGSSFLFLYDFDY